MNNYMCISGVIYSTGECCHTIEYSSPRRVTPFEYSSPKFATRVSPSSNVVTTFLNENFIEPWNYTRSTEDLRHVVRWHYIQRDPSYYNI